jgi:hypothetical protein
MLRRVIMLALFLIGSAVVVTRGTPSKAKSTEKRMAAAVGQLTRANGNLENLIAILDNAFTTSNGLTDGTTNGTSGSNGLTDGTINGTSGSQSAGTAHTHGSGSYAVANGNHNHGSGSYAVTNGNHTHQLPNL